MSACIRERRHHNEVRTRIRRMEAVEPQLLNARTDVLVVLPIEPEHRHAGPWARCSRTAARVDPTRTARPAACPDRRRVQVRTRGPRQARPAASRPCRSRRIRRSSGRRASIAADRCRVASLQTRRLRASRATRLLRRLRSRVGCSFRSCLRNDLRHFRRSRDARARTRRIRDSPIRAISFMFRKWPGRRFASGLGAVPWLSTIHGNGPFPAGRKTRTTMDAFVVGTATRATVSRISVVSVFGRLGGHFADADGIATASRSRSGSVASRGSDRHRLSSCVSAMISVHVLRFAPGCFRNGDGAVRSRVEPLFAAVSGKSFRVNRYSAYSVEASRALALLVIERSKEAMVVDAQLVSDARPPRVLDEYRAPLSGSLSVASVAGCRQ